MTTKEVARALGVVEGTVYNYSSRQALEWDEGFLAGLHELEHEAQPSALRTQVALLSSDKPEVAAKVAADLRAEYGRGLDRMLKRNEILANMMNAEMRPRFERIADVALRYVPAERREEFHDAMLAALDSDE